MKKLFVIILSVLLLVGICGCEKETPQPEGIAFYYCVSELSFGIYDSTIAAEYRQGIAKDNWAAILDVYLQGPKAEGLRSPFPVGLKTVATTMEQNTAYITVTEELASLSGLELTLACASLAMTCLELTGAETIVISADGALLDGQKSITMDANTLLLLDTVTE